MLLMSRIYVLFCYMDNFLKVTTSNAESPACTLGDNSMGDKQIQDCTENLTNQNDENKLKKFNERMHLMGAFFLQNLILMNIWSEFLKFNICFVFLCFQS